mmetsp:Transcript_11846/g.24463  ORF Transcript_11846/g.24463 Transcript_11846/m.24463 type:complete len:259 (-) Transcript_11846:759-1535(-)
MFESSDTTVSTNASSFVGPLGVGFSSDSSAGFCCSTIIFNKLVRWSPETGSFMGVDDAASGKFSASGDSSASLFEGSIRASSFCFRLESMGSFQNFFFFLDSFSIFFIITFSSFFFLANSFSTFASAFLASAAAFSVSLIAMASFFSSDFFSSVVVTGAFTLISLGASTSRRAKAVCHCFNSEKKSSALGGGPDLAWLIVATENFLGEIAFLARTAGVSSFCCFSFNHRLVTLPGCLFAPLEGILTLSSSKNEVPFAE